MHPLETAAQFVKGVGPGRAALLEKLRLRTVEELLYHFPRAHADRQELTPIADVEPEQTVTVVATVQEVRLRRARRVTVVEAIVSDPTGRLPAVWFNQPYLADQFGRGTRLALSGKVRFGGGRGRLVLSNPEYDFLPEGRARGLHTSGLVPRYPLTKGIGQKGMRRIIRNALDQFGSKVEEFLPSELMNKRRLMPRLEALRQLHFPTDEKKQAQARHRLAYEEFFLFQAGVSRRRARHRRQARAEPLRLSSRLDARIRKRFPFELTGAQRRALEQLAQDLQQATPMNRLLQGDVGSGKTVVALYAMLAAVANKRQAAFMAPTEILAEQHFETLCRMLQGSRVRIALLTSAVPHRKKQALYQQIQDGELDLVVGTHALLEQNVAFARLSVVVIDEQHRFGVLQRACLRAKGTAPEKSAEKSQPHVLVMTATPIPRTLSLTFYGTLDVSVLDELPPGRVPVRTFVRGPDQVARLHAFVRERIRAGEQAYFVYPLIDHSDELPLRSATEMARRFREEVFPDIAVELLHGSLPPEAKKRIMEQFRDGALKLLVSTVVIEVGIDVPEATVMVIDHAERYGLSQLHQLRGRIGRGSKPAYCVLLVQSASPLARRRIEVLAETTDGFRIAEEDLKLRGPGEFFGTRQHGMPDFRVGDLTSDLSLLTQARDDAFAWASRPAGNRGRAESVLWREVLRRFGQTLDLARVG